MADKLEIIICLGSSCFSRGNKALVKQIDDYLKNNRLKDKVFYHGSHCFGLCEKGPILKIGEKMYHQVNQDNILKILNENLGNLT